MTARLEVHGEHLCTVTFRVLDVGDLVQGAAVTFLGKTEHPAEIARGLSSR